MDGGSQNNKGIKKGGVRMQTKAEGGGIRIRNHPSSYAVSPYDYPVHIL